MEAYWEGSDFFTNQRVNGEIKHIFNETVWNME
jgi:hypothetical protein